MHPRPKREGGEEHRVPRPEGVRTLRFPAISILQSLSGKSGISVVLFVALSSRKCTCLRKEIPWEHAKVLYSSTVPGESMIMTTLHSSSVNPVQVKAASKGSNSLYFPLGMSALVVNAARRTAAAELVGRERL